ncbi:hypothetical protein [Thysanoplusia orichalcea nucleopolyhedrovirus]|uniref:Ac108 n=1 Tax=Thysanoplusia orichalcea nucleopolyhedrovirus TaxID=101850 RepID=L0CLR2_9ABAC|nr:hypothetical protein [Thysanoplusia orichalcea nucleopolyhedrovirus]AGA16258.1 hypothetical protein [Thysanoplusia orichalcea nucleopolyhedrovirus]
MKTTAANILSKATGGRAGNNIVDIIQASNSPTDGDQLGQFVERNRSLIKEFVLVVCGFLIFIMIVLFFMLLVVILLNQETITVRQKQYETTLLENYDIRNRND